jgi:beta-galactosidase
MVRLWTWACLSRMAARWSVISAGGRSPFAQEQFHAALLQSDSTPDQAHHEIAAVVAEAAQMPPVGPREKTRVAFVLDYPSRWATITLPQGQSYRARQVALDWYAAVRRLGVDLDVIGQHSDLVGL